MPARNKTYSFQTTPTGGSTRPLPEAPKRATLIIQNTGGAPGRVHFGAPCQGNGADLIWPAGFMFVWNQPGTCPLDSVNLASDAATTWVVVEGIDNG